MEINANAAEIKEQEKMTDKDALIECLYLAVIAPTRSQARKAVELAERIACSLTSEQVNEAQSSVERLLSAQLAANNERVA